MTQNTRSRFLGRSPPSYETLSSYPTVATSEAASTWLIMLRDDNVAAAEKTVFADWLLQSAVHIHKCLWCDQLCEERARRTAAARAHRKLTNQQRFNAAA